MKIKKILVTGGAGFIGWHLVSALIGKGYKVVVVDNLSTGRKENVNPKSIFYKLDTNDPRLEAIFKKYKFSAVYMLAFNTDVPKSVKYPVFDAQSIAGTLKTLEFARRHKVKKVFFASTSFVYGNAKHLPTRETDPVIPDNPYIISKAACENYVQLYGRIYGLQYVIFRFATTYGPGQTKGAMADYIRSIHAGRQAAVYGDGSKTRDYIYVGDIVRANLMALAQKSTPRILPVFNSGSNKEITLYSLYKKIGKLLGQPDAEPKFFPDRPGELIRSKLDNSKARKIFNWKPFVSLDEGLKRTIKYSLDNKDNQ